MEAYETLSAALTGLIAKGYTLDFNYSVDKIVCHDTPVSLMPHDFEIVEV